MIRKLCVCLPLALLSALVISQVSADDDQARSHRPIGLKTLQGTYTFAARAIVNPLVPPPDPQNPVRVAFDCFAIGELRFDGQGGLDRRVEIRCPTTLELLQSGLGSPPPIGQPTQEQIDVMGTTLTHHGTYELGTDGWGRFSDAGAVRFGPLPGNASTSAGRILVGHMSEGIAEEIEVLIDHQSGQPLGAPMLLNSDVGQSFVARRR